MADARSVQPGILMRRVGVAPVLLVVLLVILLLVLVLLLCCCLCCCFGLKELVTVCVFVVVFV